jgi:hypothetical protein
MSDLIRERSIDQAVAARAATARSAETGIVDRTNGKPPRSFEELLKGGGAKAATCHCGQTATVVMQMTARPISGRGPGARRAGMAAAIASHNSKLCEPCAVALFSAFREETR